MNAEKFTYWLQGFVELSNVERPSVAQWNSIKAHLNLVFKKETPVVHPVGPNPIVPQWPRFGDTAMPVMTC